MSIWIKDKIDGNTNIIRAKKLSGNELMGVSIYSDRSHFFI